MSRTNKEQRKYLEKSIKLALGDEDKNNKGFKKYKGALREKELWDEWLLEQEQGDGNGEDEV